ncbi:hydantoinase/oxoprolinase family protein [Nocardioides carbamazepini]|uniref:hydantoinase/oxoprolinase family protein n=1 Tax=Nocardioides carbamazepini TaxID=2854259 RepID=UPI00214A56D4|nr:hydantoinase/oxoprolinase family protein [Nocardioides carbamazepini]MCR1782698.1 hydantoinase/oxoprolinase family protein [Nocardioides carbamazepini]
MTSSAQPFDGYLIGTDIGGTFTDLVLLESGRRPRLFKSPTTPHDRSEGIIDALELAATSVGTTLPRFASQIRYFAHGTTAATNALIERKGAATGLLTTAGFADTMLIQRSMTSWVGMGSATGHYSRRRNPEPIVGRDAIVEVPERVDAAGTVLVALDEDEVRSALRRLRAAGVQALATSFLWSFLNPRAELRVREIVEEEWPEVYLTLSHEISPVIGEYERTATTVVNSYLGPVIRDYMENLEGRLHATGFDGELSVMDSGGGVMRASDAARRSASLLTSGPAGGVLATARVADAMGFSNVITSDMGGTSFDVGLILDGEPLVERQSEVGNYHLAIPRIKVTAIGAGGGSIAWVDEVGALVVGPESAGSVPGPACYGRGGVRPTVTDADVVLGIIDPDYFLGGRMTLDRHLAEEAIREHIADPLGMSVEEAALGIRTVADNQMADLLRKVTVEQGRDPRDFVVFAYGGAGPTHACAYTQAAGINTLVVPPTSTVHSAYGTVTADRFRALQATDPPRTPPGADDPASTLDLDRLRSTLADLADRVHADLDHAPEVRFVRSVHLKFRRQTHELPVVLPDGEVTVDVMRAVIEEFFETYERIYGKGTALRSAGLELNTLRVEGRAAVAALAPSAPFEAGSLDTAQIGTRDVVFGEVGRVEVPVHRGELVGSGAQLVGPAVLEFEGTTIVVGPGQELTVDANANIIINCKGN